jgi:hypothetical protein
MTPIGKLIDHDDSRLRMVAVHRMWALWFRQRRDDRNTAVQFHAARQLLDDAREHRILMTGHR